MPIARSAPTGHTLKNPTWKYQRLPSGETIRAKISPLLLPLAVPLDSLTLDPNNARLHPEESHEVLKASYLKYGQKKCIVVNREARGLIVVAGNGTVAALRELGWTHVAANVEEMDVGEAMSYGLDDNRTAEASRWDMKALAATEALLADMGEGPIGWSTEELAEIRQSMVVINADPEEVPALPSTALSRSGDLWRLGDHRLLCGDAKSRKDFSRLMNGRKATLLFTDPPYGVSIGAKNRLLNSFQKAGRCLTNIVDDDHAPEDLSDSLLEAFNVFKQVAMGDDCTIMVCSPQGGDLCMMMMNMMERAGLKPRHVIIWRKNQPTFSMGRLDYDYQHEPILMTWAKRHKNKKKGKFQTSVWDVPKPRKSPLHPTMKPVELPENAILNHTDVGNVVCDFYLGTGTTMIAAHKHGRACYGMEIEPRYIDVILKRWADFTGIDPVREDGVSFSRLRNS